MNDILSEDIMKNHGYKKYMKKEAQNNNPFIKIFVLSFFGMLLLFTFIIKSFSPTVDTSIGDYKEHSTVDEQSEKNIIDDRLRMIQNEDQGRNFTELMSRAEEEKPQPTVESTPEQETVNETIPKPQPTSEVQKSQDVVYRVYVGSYTSAEQAKVAKDIIQESGNGLNPIVKCIGSNNYTLQVGIFKNKQSAESMLYTIQQSHLPGRIVQEY